MANFLEKVYEDCFAQGINDQIMPKGRDKKAHKWISSNLETVNLNIFFNYGGM